MLSKASWVIICTLALAFGIASSAQAVTLTSGNSSVTLNPVFGPGFTPYVSSWVVDGVDQYGGSPAGSEDLQVGFGLGTSGGLNRYPLTTSSSTASTYTATYSFEQLGSLTVNDVLAGGNTGSGQSTFDETFTINNTGTESFLIHLADIAQITVGGSDANNVLTLTPSSDPNTATQTNNNGTTVKFVAGPTDTFYTSPDGGTTQTTSTGPITGSQPLFSFGYSPTVAPGATVTFSMTETVNGGASAPSGGTTPSAVPLPNSFASALTLLLGLGAVSLTRRAWRAA